MKKIRFAAFALLMALAAPVLSTDFTEASHAVQHVVLVSIDGFHAADLTRFIADRPDSMLAKLAAKGTVYTHAMSPVPADSFPGLLALVTGGTPKSTGVVYDDSYDAALSPPGSDCKEIGTDVVLDEAADKDENARDTTLDESKLPRDPSRGCAVVYPHQFLRVNTVFEAIKARGGRTAWADKHPAYDLVNGPSGMGVDDLFLPEINADGTTDSVKKTEAYDDTKVVALVNRIAGHDRAGAGALPVPTILGMNFQAVSVAQKLRGAGYRDAQGTPSDSLLDAMVHTDASLARIVDALAAARLADKTLVIVTAKHGQSPVDPSLRKILDKKALTKVIADAAPGGIAHATYDTAAYIWLKDHRDAAAVARALAEHSAEFSVFKIYEGDAMAEFFNDAKKDGRMPDVMMQPNEGVIITKAAASKIAEHGGSFRSDRNVALLVVGPGVRVGVNENPVATTSVAATILESLGIDATALEAVRIEGTGALPGLKF